MDDDVIKYLSEILKELKTINKNLESNRTRSKNICKTNKKSVIDYSDKELIAIIKAAGERYDDIENATDAELEDLFKRKGD